MSGESKHSDLFGLLIELAKSGSGTEIRAFLHQQGQSASSRWESQYYQMLSNEWLMVKGAREPELLLPDSIEQPKAEAYGSAPVEIIPFVYDALIYHDWTLLEEILRILKSQKKIIPPRLLPLILQRCKAQNELHSLLQETLGSRSLWLAAQRKEWHWWCELNQEDDQKVNSENLLAWLLLHHRKKYLELSTPLNNLQPKDRKKFFIKILNGSLDTDDVLLIRPFLEAKSTSEKGLAASILLKIKSKERDLTWIVVKKHLDKYLTVNKSQLNLSKINQKEYPPLPIDLSTITFNDNHIADPFWQLVSLFSPQEILGHLTINPGDIVNQLILDQKLKPLLQIIVEATANHPQAGPWLQLILHQWRILYPDGNTTAVSLKSILKVVSYDLYQKNIAHLLTDQDDYFLAKLEIMTTDTTHYIRKDLSIKLVERLFQLLQQRLNRRDVDHLLLILPKLQYRLDPRVSNVVTSQWVEMEHWHQTLSTLLWNFRNMLRRRSEILSCLVDH